MIVFPDKRGGWRGSGTQGEEARVLGEEARRRLSGHGFSTERREERRLSRSEFADLRKQSSGGSKGEGPFGRRTKSAEQPYAETPEKNLFLSH